MINTVKRLILIGLFALPFMAKTQVSNTRQTELFDKGWSFIQMDVPGAQKPDFDDSKWGVLDLPHDWSILGTANQNNLTGRGGGYMPSGIGWYRKEFSLDKSDAQKRYLFILMVLWLIVMYG